MKIEYPEDVNLSRIVRLLPSTAYALRAFTSRMTIKISREFPTFSVRMRKNGPEMQINPDFAAEHIKTEHDLAMATFHEWLHVLREHLSSQRMGLIFGLDLKVDKDFFGLPKRQRDMITFVQELEIKHLEHLLMPDDEFHELNRRYYADNERPEIRMLYRGTNAEELGDLYYEAVHDRVFSRSRYSTREAYYLLKERAEEEGEPIEERVPGEDDVQVSVYIKGGPGDPDVEGSGPPMIVTASGVDGDVSQEDMDALLEAFDQLLDGAREEAAKPEEPEEKESEAPGPDEKDGDDEEEKAAAPPPRKPGESPPGTGTTFDEDVKDRVKVARRRAVERAAKRVRTKPNYLSRVSAAFSRQTSKARSRSTIPNFSTDRRAQRDYVMGRYRSKYARRKGVAEELFALYFDISYSQDAFIPHCNEVVLQLKRMFVNRTVFVFSDYVVEVPITTFIRRAKAGTVTGLVNSRGTNFTAVAEHAAANGFHRLAILTDNQGMVSEETLAPLTKRRDFYLLMIQTNPSPSYEARGFAPFMKERIFIDSDDG